MRHAFLFFIFFRGRVFFTTEKDEEEEILHSLPYLKPLTA
jgi:hypothetical protein